MSTDRAEQCCPPFDPEPWDEQQITWEEKKFVKDRVRSFLHIPLNFGGVMKRNAALIEAGSALGIGIANLINIFNPEMIVIGGTLSLAGKYLLPAIQETVEKTAMPEIFQQAQILLSAFGPDASVMGAAALVVKAILSNPSSVGRLATSA